MIKKLYVMYFLISITAVIFGTSALGSNYSDSYTDIPQSYDEASNDCFFESNSVTVEQNGKQIKTSGFIIDGRTFVPARSFFDNIGLNVEWDEASRTVTAKNDKCEIAIPADSKYFWVNGKIISLDVPHKIINDRMYIPVRKLSEAIGADVIWNETEQSVLIKITDKSILEAERTIVDLPKNPVSMVDAMVDGVDVENKVIYFSFSENGCYKLDMSEAEEFHIYVAISDTSASEIELRDLLEYDIVSIAYDNSTEFDKSKIYSIYVSRTTLESKLKYINNNSVYVMDNSKSYICLCENKYDMDIEENSSYSFHLDIFDRIVYIDLLCGLPYKFNYGVLQNVIFENDRYYAELIDENGVERIPLNNELTAKRLKRLFDIHNRLINNSEAYKTYIPESISSLNSDIKTKENILDLSCRVISYVKTKDGVMTRFFTAFSYYSLKEIYPRLFENEYSKATHKLGGLDMSRYAIIDLREFKKNGTYKLIDESQLTDHKNIIYGRFLMGGNIIIIY